MKDKSIKLIEWQKAGLEDLLVILCLKRRINRGLLDVMGRGEHRNPACSLNVAPTYLQLRPTRRPADNRWKSLITFSPEGPGMATKTIELFIVRAVRLYEEEQEELRGSKPFRRSISTN